MIFKESLFLPELEGVTKEYRDKFNAKVEQNVKDDSIANLLNKSIATASSVHFYKSMLKTIVMRLDAKKNHPIPAVIDFFEAFNQFHFDGRLALIKGKKS